MDQNKSDSLPDEDPAIVPCKKEEMTVISFSQLTHQVHLVSRSSDGNSRARRRPRKMKISSQIKENDI